MLETDIGKEEKKSVENFDPFSGKTINGNIILALSTLRFAHAKLRTKLLSQFTFKLGKFI